MKTDNKISGTMFCVIGKCKRLPLPHVISCTIGIDNEMEAMRYSKQLAKTKEDYDKRKNIYEWTKPKKLSEAYNDKDIMMAFGDRYFIQKFFLKTI